MAENLPKLQASWGGYRSHFTQTLQKADALLTKESPTESDLVSMTNILEQLSRKKNILSDLDKKIATLLKEPNDIAKEIFDSEVIQKEIDETSSQISNLFPKLSTKKSTSTASSDTVGQLLGTSPSSLQAKGQSGILLDAHGVPSETCHTSPQVVQVSNI